MNTVSLTHLWAEQISVTYLLYLFMSVRKIKTNIGRNHPLPVYVEKNINIAQGALLQTTGFVVYTSDVSLISTVCCITFFFIECKKIVCILLVDLLVVSVFWEMRFQIENLSSL